MTNENIVALLVAYGCIMGVCRVMAHEDKRGIASGIYTFGFCLALPAIGFAFLVYFAIYAYGALLVNLFRFIKPRVPAVCDFTVRAARVAGAVTVELGRSVVEFGGFCVEVAKEVLTSLVSLRRLVSK